ncbi:MAG: hypothetical protein KAT17_07680 [Candidatus Aminicenantes bacterium]|nr:hypothetical protein [Candidatus Aminicenantes bacterium]
MGKLKYFILFLITVIFLFLSFYLKFPYLYEWDSVNYVKATGEFNLFLNQPHPPGYLGFVLVLKLFISLFNSPLSGFVVLVLFSYIVFALVSTLLLKELTRICFNTWVYLFFLSVPMVLCHSLVTTIYLTEGATVVCLVFVLLKIFQKKWHPAFVLLLLIGGLIKTNIPVILLPLAVYVLFVRIEKKWLRRVIITAFIILNLFWYFGLNKIVFYYSKAPDHLDALISDYIIKDNIFSAYMQGLGNIAVTLVKNIKNVLLALAIQIIPLAIILAVRSGKITVFKFMDRQNRLFIFLWIMPQLLFVTFLYFPKNGYLLEIIAGISILVIACFNWEKIEKRVKWIWVVNLLIFFIPLNIDYFDAKVRVSGADKTFREYAVTQAVRIFETTHSHIRSVKKVYEYYFSEIKKIGKEGNNLFILNNIVADYRVIPYYLKDFEFLIVQKEKNNFIVSSFKNDILSVKLIKRTQPEFVLEGYDNIYLITSTPSAFQENMVEIKNTIYKLVDDSININGLNIKPLKNKVQD